MTADLPTSEPTVAIDLSRRKGGASIAAPPRVATMAEIGVRALARDRLARCGALLLAVLALVAVFADLVASDLPIACRWRGVVYVMPNVVRPPALSGLDCAAMRRQGDPGDWMLPPLVAHGPNTRSGDRAARLLPPLAEGHPLGTDALGHDVLARVVHGARTALGVGLVASLLLVAIGVTLGALSGFAGGLVDALVARLVESVSAIPTIVLVLVVGALVRRPTTATLICTIALTRWTDLARMVRAETLVALRSDYVTAARALGVPASRVLSRHVLPNAMGPAIVAAAFAVAWVVLVEATVDFLRAGAPEGGASWGELLGQARANGQAWWLVAFPAAALLTTLLALNLVGEAARNAFDPRLRGA